MENYLVAIINIGYEHYELEKRLLGKIGAKVRIVDEDCRTEAQVIAASKDAHAIMLREAPFTRKVIDTLTCCKIIARYGVGVDHIDLEAARRRQIYVCNVPDYCTEEVSDHALALILACLRNLPLRDRRVREGIFESDINDSIYRASGKTMGLVGYGKIAQTVHRKWQGFLPRQVLVCDPFMPADIIQQKGAHKVELNTLLQDSDIVSLHAPLTEKTHHLISIDAFRLMKPTAILVNTSRGGLINEAALADALKSNRILAAGLDVFENEPISAEHPFMRFSNVVLSSHVAWYSKEAVVQLQADATKEVLRVLSNEKPKNWVNPW